MTGGFDLTQNINLRDPELLDDFRQILDRRAAGSLKVRGASNKIKERIGERNALNRIQQRFPGSRQLVVATRSNGVPVLDMVLVDRNGKVIVVEAKFSSSGRLNLGRSNSRMWLNTSRGWRQIKIKGGTSQMSPRWIENRVIELEKMGHRRLAGQIKQALFSRNVEAYTIVTDRTGEVLRVHSHTDEWKAAYSNKGTQFRPQSTAARAGVVEGTTARAAATGDRAVANRVAAGAARKEAQAVAGSTARSLAVRQGAQVALRGAAVRTAARVVARVLVAIIARVMMILNVVGLMLFAFQILQTIYSYFREKAITAAIEKGMQSHIPVEINRGLEQNKDEIARLYARAWLNKGNQSALFLYLSPRMVVEGGMRDRLEYEAHVPVKTVVNDLVSTRYIEPTRDTIVWDTGDYHKIQIRWSVAQPIYTPFDIYLTYIEFFVEHVVDSWAMLYGTGTKLPAATEKLFHSTVETLAHISATLKYEPWFGYEAEGRRFPPDRVAVARWEALQALSVKIHKDLIPKASALEGKGLINTATVRLEAFLSPMRSEIDPRGEVSMVPSMRKVAHDMKYLDSKYLEYERFETLHARTAARASLAYVVFNATIEGQKMLDLREYLEPVRRHLPKSLAGDDFILEIPAETAGGLVLDPNVP